jgi:hypothetical protein
MTLLGLHKNVPFYCPQSHSFVEVAILNAYFWGPICNAVKLKRSVLQILCRVVVTTSSSWGRVFHVNVITACVLQLLTLALFASVVEASFIQGALPRTRPAVKVFGVNKSRHFALRGWAKLENCKILFADVMYVIVHFVMYDAQNTIGMYLERGDICACYRFIASISTFWGGGDECILWLSFAQQKYDA